MMNSKMMQLLQEMESGHPVRIAVDCDTRSMCGLIEPGQILTLTPVTSGNAAAVGDIALVRWRKGNYLLHRIGACDGSRFLIVNSRGKRNGWVSGTDVLARVSLIETGSDSAFSFLLSGLLPLASQPAPGRQSNGVV